MAIIFNDNIQVSAGKPIDNKYLNAYNAPYTGTSEVLSTITVPQRHVGLTVNINNDEYWFATGVSNSDLILKVGASGGTFNGISNVGSGVGLFSGVTSSGVNYFKTISGSGGTTVVDSGDTVVISTSSGLATLNDDILRFNSGEQKYEPYSAYTSGVTFYEGDVSPSGTTRLNLNARLAATEFRVSTGHTASGYTHTPGDIFWDNDDSTLTIQQTDFVTQQIGQELLGKAKNDTAGLIPNGTVVYISGSDGDRVTIEPARAYQSDGSIVTHVLGITTEDIPAGKSGFVTNFGIVREINTSGYTEGDILYLSPSIWGGFTNVKPDYPNYALEIGIVTFVDEFDGKILIKLKDVSRPQPLRNVVVINPPYTADTRTDVISSVGSGTIYLPASPTKGQQITILDHDGDAELFTITVNGNGKLINGENEGIINTNYGSITVVYNGYNWYATIITP